MIRAFAKDWTGAFRDSWGAARAIPLLFVLMAGVELAQHVAELHLGFFSADAAVRKAASLDPGRMAFGWPKMLTLYAVSFVTIRFLVLGSVGQALRPTGKALGRYAWVGAFQLLPAIAIVYAEPILAATGLGVGVTTARSVVGVAQLLVEPLLLLWFVDAALGTDAFGPIGSARTTRWLYLWTFAALFAVRVPLAQMHGWLNILAAGRPPALQWAMLAFDACVVGVLALAVPAIQVRAARHVAERRGMALVGHDARADATHDRLPSDIVARTIGEGVA